MRVSTATVFAGYVLLASTRWVLDAAMPSSISASECGGLASLLICAGVLLLPRPGGVVGVPGGPGWQRGVAGTLLFGVAWALSGLGGNGVPSSTRTALFALVPVGVILITAAREAAGIDFLGVLGGALAGVSGVFLLLPVDPEVLVRNPAELVGLLAVICGLSFGSSVIQMALRHLSVRAGMLVVLLPGILVSMISLVHRGDLRVPVPGDVASVVWRAAEILALLYLLREVGPVPLSARFMLVPLVVAGEGLLYLRPALTWGLAMGLGLLVFGSVRLMRERGGGRDSRLSLL